MVALTRRGFLAGLGAGFGLALVPRVGIAKVDGVEAAGLSPSVFLHIGVDGAVTYCIHRSEMGQGVRSSLYMLVADELGADPARVTQVQADGHPKYGDQNTDGSSSVRGKHFQELRTIGATARHMLIAVAAKRWRVKPETCSAQDHQIVHAASKRRLPFAELVAEAAKLPVPKDVPLRPQEELAHLGQALPLVDSPAYVTGKAIYGADVRVPGALVAVIVRPPVVGGKVLGFDSAATLATPGVKRLVSMPAPSPPWAFQPWGGIAVVAENTWAAMRGAARLAVEWDSGEHASYDSEAFRAEMEAALQKEGKVVRQLGDAPGALAAAKQRIRATYHVPHLHHMAMEPLTATARLAGGRCEIWAPTQNPQAARSAVALALGMKEDDVIVHVTFLGGGFGRKSKADFVVEAALLAREVGAPVRVQWSREDDVRHGYYNTVNAQRLEAGLDERGQVVALHHRTCFPPIASTFNPAAEPGLGEMNQGVLDVAFGAVPSWRAEAVPAPAHVRIGWFRSVYNIFHAFAVGSFVDEIAAAKKQDPRETWLELIGPPRVLSLADLGVEKLANYGAPVEQHPVDAGRLRRVVERVTELCKWSEARQAGRALGLAAHRSFLSYSACVISAVKDPVVGVRFDEAWLVMDSGTVVNMDRARSQLEGALVMGLSNALYGGIHMKGGRTVEQNFREARVARIRDVPRQLHVEMLPSDGPPCGIGEPGVPPVGAAVANAIFALTGKRLRDIPLSRGLASG